MKEKAKKELGLRRVLFVFLTIVKLVVHTFPFRVRHMTDSTWVKTPKGLKTVEKWEHNTIKSHFCGNITPFNLSINFLNFDMVLLLLRLSNKYRLPEL